MSSYYKPDQRAASNIIHTLDTTQINVGDLLRHLKPFAIHITQALLWLAWNDAGCEQVLFHRKEIKNFLDIMTTLKVSISYSHLTASQGKLPKILKARKRSFLM